MKHFPFFILWLLVLQGSLFSQPPITSPSGSRVMGLPEKSCHFDELMNQQRAARSLFSQEEENFNRLVREHTVSGSRAVLTIPVVVHVIHQNGAEEISYDQILAGIQHLNDAFANTGSYAETNGIATDIQFCLAQRDPFGESTTGVNYVESELTEMNAETDDLALKNLIRWNPDEYLNIWLVKEITSFSMGSGVAGYAFFPTSHGAAEDGIVNEAALFGSSVNNSKVHIHEAGHYLGLYHTFEGGCTNTNCALNGDRVCDTPPDNSTSAVFCGQTINTCTSDEDDPTANNPFRPISLGGLGDQPDSFENYMDYGFQDCQAWFSAGQSLRMRASLEGARNSLLESQGCVSPCGYMPVATITNAVSNVIVGTTLNLSYPVTTANAYRWYLNGTLVSEEITYSPTLSEVGVYTITLQAFYNEDETCFRSTSFAVDVACSIQAQFTVSSSDNFSTGSTLTATNTTEGEASYVWHFDGTAISTETNWSELFEDAGSHRLFLTATNELCTDSSLTFFFEIGNCNLSACTNNWMFQGQHVNFGSGAPHVFSQGLPVSSELWLESSSSLSNAQGELLLYADVNHVYNRAFQVMPNGSDLIGGTSSTQGVLIVPHPGSPNQYIVITNDETENFMANGLHYSVVDLTLDGGLGDVLPDQKNIPLTTLNNEMLSATWHSNGRDIWVVTSNYHTREYLAFLIDASGFHTEPVRSAMEPGESGVDLGRIKFSHDGMRAALFDLMYPWHIVMADFDKSTGHFTEALRLPTDIEVNEQIYGLEFSSDNSKLYASHWQGNNVIQFDLSLTTASAIQNSKTVIDPYEYGGFSEILLGADDKLYVRSVYGVDVIENPNLPGIACGYTTEAPGWELLEDQGLSMPNFMTGLRMPRQARIIGPTILCSPFTTEVYGLQLGSDMENITWSHSGPGSIAPTEANHQIFFTNSNAIGRDTLFVEFSTECGVARDTLVVLTVRPELLQLPEQLNLCETDIILDAGEGYESYLWNNGSNSSSIEVSAEGVYTVVAEDESGCFVSDTTLVVAESSWPALELGDDVSICDGQTITLIPNANYVLYNWTNSWFEPALTVYAPGTYWLTVEDFCGFTDTDSLTVTEELLNLELTYNGQNTICASELPIVLEAPTGFSLYQWSTGDTGSSLFVSEEGSYTLTAITASGCTAADSLVVEECISIAEANRRGISVFPNPAVDGFQLQLSSAKYSGWSIYSSTGQLIAEHSQPLTTSQWISTVWLSAGYYLLVISDGIEKIPMPLVIEK